MLCPSVWETGRNVGFSLLRLPRLCDLHFYYSRKRSGTRFQGSKVIWQWEHSYGMSTDSDLGYSVWSSHSLGHIFNSFERWSMLKRKAAWVPVADARSPEHHCRGMLPTAQQSRYYQPVFEFHSLSQCLSCSTCKWIWHCLMPHG